MKLAAKVLETMAALVSLSYVLAECSDKEDCLNGNSDGDMLERGGKLDLSHPHHP
jgi:hypothetical protein